VVVVVVELVVVALIAIVIVADWIDSQLAVHSRSRLSIQSPARRE
jgi:hypothetical protein